MDGENLMKIRVGRRKQCLPPEFLRLPSPSRPRGKNADITTDELNKTVTGNVSDDESGSVISVVTRESRTSSNSRATSRRSQVLRQKMQAEISSLEKMSKLQEEAEQKRLQREMELEKRRLEMQKLIIEENGLDSDGDDPSVAALPNPSAVPNTCEVPKPNVQAWLENQSQAAKESHTEKQKEDFQQQMAMTNYRLEKLLTRQTVSKELPFFGGNPEEWPMFLRQFQRTTELCGLSDDENMVRLYKALKGKARDTVLPFMGVPENVGAVMQTLELMFGRPDQVIETMVQKTRSTPAPKEGKPESLILFSNQISNLVANIQLLKKTGHLANPTLINELVISLPYQLRYQWCSWSMFLQHDATLTDLAEWMRGVAMTVSLMPTEIICTNENVNNKIKKTVLTAVNKIEKSTCLYCQKAGHELADCSKFAATDFQVRWKFAKSKYVCYGCLMSGHRSSDCKATAVCGVDGCSRSHHKLLHKVKANEEKDNVNESGASNAGSSLTEFVGHAALDRAMKEVLLRVIPIKLSSPTGEISTFALLDEGSAVTMIDDVLAKKLQLDGPVNPLCIQWTNGLTKAESQSRRVSLEVSGIHTEAKIFTLFNVRTVNNMALPDQTIDMEKIRENWPYLRDVPFESLVKAVPKILIGSDNYLLITPRKLRQGQWNDPVATKTWLGWVVHGNIVTSQRLENSLAFHVCEVNQQDVDLNKLVQDSFSTEGFGVRIREKPLRSRQDEQALSYMKATTKRIGDRYETGLLWREESIRLPESRSNALRRLQCMERKMDRDSIFSEEYSKKIEDYIAKGYCRKLTNSETIKHGSRTYYIPHFAVYNPNKPGKLRLVMDAASKSRGVSLNDCLFKGPDFLNPLPAVLMRFRIYRVSIMGDIKEMFHQVKIIDEDQDSQRFLWLGKERGKEPDVYVMTSMIFGAACSPSSAQYVKNLMAEENKEEFPGLYNAIVQDMYMDDLLQGGDNESEAIEKVNQFINIFQRGGFHICNWASSSKEVMERIPSEFRAKGMVQLNMGNTNVVERVLGLKWSPEEDAFIFELVFHKVDWAVLSGQKVPSKREVLRLIMSLFDPLGFLGHFVIKAKILFQQIWLSKIGWDEQLTEVQNNHWRLWLEQLQRLVDVKIPRCYSLQLKISDSIQLHTFTDASQEAMAAVCYLRIKTGDLVETAFVLGRTRVAPTKPLSVPRLELQAALMGARMTGTVAAELKLTFSEIHFWCDSRTVLCWIRSESRNFKQFVAHRIGEILELTQVNQWHWVPTLINAADDGTRSGTDTDLTSTSRWLIGPDFLKTERESWPEEPDMNYVLLPAEESKKELVCVSFPIKKFEFPSVDRFSSWLKTIRTTAWCCRFVENWTRRHKGLNLFNGELMVAELQQAERFWWRAVQRECFPLEFDSLKSNKPLPVNSRLRMLSPFLDEDGVMRVRGRTEQATNLNQDTKYPIILDPGHKFTALLLYHFHEKGGYHGLETVLSNLRQKYWVLQMRGAVKKVFYNCMKCKIRKAKPSPPQMGMLPQERLQSQIAPFVISGVDYFGPLMITEGRKRLKRYGVLFTCMATRAIHLELAKDLSADTTILAIRRFVGRRGPVKKLLSDNGTNFRGADAELQLSLRTTDEMRLKLASRGIDWQFIPPGSPHMGGCWERMVKSVKIALADALKTDAPYEDTLLTLLIEAENLVNSRPLTHVSVDPDDPVSLTPNHFLRMGQMDGPIGEFDDKDLHLRRQWRKVQRYADIFRSRWVQEYLPTLTRKTKWYADGRAIIEDDIVVVADKDGPRNSWPLGRIVAVYPGKDGKVRVVDVKTKDGTYRRPASKICILDVKKDDE